MRPNLTFVLIVLAIIVSIAAGIATGGGWQVWMVQPAPGTGTNTNAELPLAPATQIPVVE